MAKSNGTIPVNYRGISGEFDPTSGTVSLTIDVNAIGIESKPAKGQKQGKSLVFASTGGNQVIGADAKGNPISLGINAFRKNPEFVDQSN